MATGFESAFVTGGSGFIGGRLVRRLAEEGVKVRALARSDASAAAVEEHGAEAMRGDLDDVEPLAAGAEGCEVTFHLAALAQDWGPFEEFERINVQGTENTLEASRKAGVRRFVHCGTEAAVLAGQPLVGADETVPLQPDSPSPYSATKARAEEIVREADGQGIETVVIRPRFVWGAGDTTLLPEIGAQVRSGRWAWVDGGRHRTSITHVDNVVEGLIAAAERGKGGEAYFVTDGEPVVFRDFITKLLRTQGIEAPDREVPVWIAGTIAMGGEAVWKLLRLRGRPPLTRFALWAATQDCVLDDSKARSELGYEPVRTHEEGLRELADAEPVGA